MPLGDSTETLVPGQNRQTSMMACVENKQRGNLTPCIRQHTHTWQTSCFLTRANTKKTATLLDTETAHERKNNHRKIERATEKIGENTVWPSSLLCETPPSPAGCALSKICRKLKDWGAALSTKRKRGCKCDHVFTQTETHTP